MQDSERPSESAEVSVDVSSTSTLNTEVAVKPAVFSLQWFFQTRVLLVLLGLLLLFTLSLNWMFGNELEQAQKQQVNLLKAQETLLQQNQALELALSRQGQSLAQLKAEYASHVAAGPNEVLSYNALKQVDEGIVIVRQWQRFRQKNHFSNKQKKTANAAFVTQTQAAATTLKQAQETEAMDYGERILQWFSLQWQSLQQASLERIGSWVQIKPLPSIEIERLDTNAMALSEDGLLQFLLSARLALLARQNEDAIVSLELVEQRADFLFAQINDASAQRTYQSLSQILQNALRILRGR